jgi:hypothetical protein
MRPIMSVLALAALIGGGLALPAAGQEPAPADTAAADTATAIPETPETPAASEVAAAAASGLAVAEIAVGTGYDRESRQLVGAGETFSAGTEQVWCRTRITGAPEPTTVAHVWYHNDKTVARVELRVGSADWRTVSSKTLLPDWTGFWEVKVLDEAGTVLGSTRFTVE